MPSSVSAVVRDNIAQVVMPGSPEAWERRNLVSTCSNGASEESIGIYAKNRCQCSGCLIHLEPRPQSHGRLKPQGPLGTAVAAKAPRGLGGLPKQKCVLEVP